MKVKTIFSCLTARAATTLLAMMLTTLSAWADDSGKCGTNLSYSYHTSTQTLDIYTENQGSTGSMTNYYPDDDYYHVKAPWKNSRAEIKRVNIGEGVTSIGNCTFYGCTALTEVNIASTVTDIGNKAFYNCTSLTHVTLPSGVTSIGSFAFYGCSGLTTVSIPESVANIGSCAFQGCSGLARVIFHRDATSTSTNIFNNCPATLIIYGPAGSTAESIANSQHFTFIAIGRMATPDFTLPAAMTTVEAEAFAGAKMAVVYIPDGVTTLGSKAFAYCTNLTQIRIPASVTVIPADLLYNINKSQITIFGAPDSAAETFASNAGIKFAIN